MGQQQLLLLVLGIVIVGLAVVVGINAFSENRIKSNADALVTDGLRIASDVQAWALKPTQFGGGNDGDPATDDLDEVDANDLLRLIGYDADDNQLYTNVNGTFSFTDGSGGDTACTAGAGTKDLYGWNDDTENCITIEISGTNSASINTIVVYGDPGTGGS